MMMKTLLLTACLMVSNLFAQTAEELKAQAQAGCDAALQQADIDQEEKARLKILCNCAVEKTDYEATIAAGQDQQKLTELQNAVAKACHIQ